MIAEVLDGRGHAAPGRPSSVAERIVMRGAGLPRLRIVHACTPELRRIAYRLRYDVYCIESAFLDPDGYPDGLERDEFDERSLHALLRHEPSGSFMGTARLIMPAPGARRLENPFASLLRDPAVRVEDVLPPESTAEVSRFAISKAFRRRVGDGVYPDQRAMRSASPNGRRVPPGLSLGLIAAVTQMGLAAGVTHVCAVMEPALLRLLRPLGIAFNLLGPPVEYHGLRQPCFAKASVLLEQVRSARPDYWDIITGATIERASPRLMATAC